MGGRSDNSSGPEEVGLVALRQRRLLETDLRVELYDDNGLHLECGMCEADLTETLAVSLENLAEQLYAKGWRKKDEGGQ